VVLLRINDRAALPRAVTSSMSAAAKRRALRGAAPGLKDFILRSQVLQQYAAFHRVLRTAGLWQRHDLRQELRESFAKHAGVEGLPARKALLSEGARQLSTLRQQLGLSGVVEGSAGVPSTWPPLASGTSSLSGRVDRHRDVEVTVVQDTNPEDARYRMGLGWPWQET